MATTLNAGTTTGTALNVTTDTTGAMAIQTSGTTAIAISSAQVVSLTNPLLPASGGTGITSLGTGVATFLGTPSSANLAGAVTDETGTGALVFAGSPTFTGTPLAPTAAAGTNTTQIATTAFVLSNGAPTGGLIMWSTSTAPTGWLLCNGAAVSRTTYAALFAIVGSTFGVGDGSTTFNLPNYVNRFPIGVGSTAALAATGGSNDAVVVSHTHTATSTDSGHIHPTPPNFYQSAPNGFAGAGGAGQTYSATYTGYANVTTTVNTAGVSGTNANLPPYLGINFIIKT
jgi:microcystin-dependent protein